MKIEAFVKQVVEDGTELSITIKGWHDTDPQETIQRHLGTINVPSNARNRRDYHIGRRIIIDVRPA